MNFMLNRREPSRYKVSSCYYDIKDITQKANVTSVGYGLRGNIFYPGEICYLTEVDGTHTRWMFRPKNVPFRKEITKVIIYDDGRVVLNELAGNDVSRFCKVHTHRQKRK